MAKAFNSASHHSIRRAMFRVDVPGPLVEYIMSGYVEASTLFELGDDKSLVTRMSRGVKQVDPL